jgi:prophage regulatory protein
MIWLSGSQLAKAARAPGDRSRMSTCKTRIDIRSSPSDSARAQVPLESSSRSAAIRILRLAQVIDMTGLGKTKIYELQAKGGFPKSVPITAHAVGWVEEEVQAWLTGRLAERNTVASGAQRFSG